MKCLNCVYFKSNIENSRGICINPRGKIEKVWSDFSCHLFYDGKMDKEMYSRDDMINFANWYASFVEYSWDDSGNAINFIDKYLKERCERKNE